MTFMVQPTPSIMRPEQALFPVTTSAQQPPTNTWCKRVFACHHCPWSIVIRTLAAAHPLTCLICHVCLCWAGKPEENMYESPTFLFPSSVPTRFFVFSPSFYWQYKWRGAVFYSLVTHCCWKSRFRLPLGQWVSGYTVRQHLWLWVKVHLSWQEVSFTPFLSEMTWVTFYIIYISAT